MGFVAKSALFSKKMRNFKQYKNWIDIDTKLYTPISQGLVMLKNTKKLSDSKKFYNFLLSNTSKEIFKKYGYIVK
jgi:molybdate transport system substrate-binding protein